MPETRAHKQIEGGLEGAARRDFIRALLRDLEAFEQMSKSGAFERGVTRIGAEQELFLVNHSYQPAPGALKLLERLADNHFTTELGLFNLEINADPQPLAGGGLRAMEQQLATLFDKVRSKAKEIDLLPVMAGILPTIGKTDLGLENMVPSPRYQTLNRVMNAARGEAFDFSIRGIDELVVKHDSVMVESCNASFQVHLQLKEPEKFAHYYNLAQLLLAPVLAAGTNSPVLFGRRLWAETRIALFEQACDIRTPGLHLRDEQGRVSFGRGWLQGSAADLYRENIARFRALVGTDVDEDPVSVLAEGRSPGLKALALHNGTIYRWNRACYGISENGKPHLRIELRVLPSGPTIADEMANAAMWLGLMMEFGETIADIPQRMLFEHAQTNLYAAAREGLGARFTWFDGEEVYAGELIEKRLLPLAHKGLLRGGVTPKDADRYIDILTKRVASQQTGSRWMLQSLAGMRQKGTMGGRLTALVAGMITRQRGDKVVSEWEKAELAENDSARTGYQKVSQYMSQDFVTVQPDDPVELVRELMAWEHVRYVAVEDDKDRLVGLISQRAVKRHFDQIGVNQMTGLQEAGNGPTSTPSVSAAHLMRRSPVTVTPDSSTLDAIELMRNHRVGCLPVVQDGHIVAVLTEDDFIGIVGKIIEQEAESQQHMSALLGDSGDDNDD